ncbi:hypothetical protein DFH06DRAFT_1134782 [Mycena polygramma]|nr:hypothetical protein DFH06DRAFT_1134782 [Mycena polygramma]
MHTHLSVLVPCVPAQRQLFGIYDTWKDGATGPKLIQKGVTSDSGKQPEGIRAATSKGLKLAKDSNLGKQPEGVRVATSKSNTNSQEYQLEEVTRRGPGYCVQVNSVGQQSTRRIICREASRGRELLFGLSSGYTSLHLNMDFFQESGWLSSPRSKMSRMRCSDSDSRKFVQHSAPERFRAEITIAARRCIQIPLAWTEMILRRECEDWCSDVPELVDTSDSHTSRQRRADLRSDWMCVCHSAWGELRIVFGASYGLKTQDAARTRAPDQEYRPQDGSCGGPWDTRCVVASSKMFVALETKWYWQRLHRNTNSHKWVLSK